MESLAVLRYSTCPGSSNPPSQGRPGNEWNPQQQRCAFLLSLLLSLLLCWFPSNSHPLFSWFYQKLMDCFLLLFPNVAWQAYGGIYHSALTYICINKLRITSVKLLVVKAWKKDIAFEVCHQEVRCIDVSATIMRPLCLSVNLPFFVRRWREGKRGKSTWNTMTRVKSNVFLLFHEPSSEEEEEEAYKLASQAKCHCAITSLPIAY